MSKHHKTKPLHSFVHEAFYLYQEHNLSQYDVKVIEFKSFSKLENYFLFFLWRLLQVMDFLINNLKLN